MNSVPFDDILSVAAEMCAVDSFVNPNAGVLVLEWKDPDSSWILLTQSYFHWVPKMQQPDSTVYKTGFILDNVESNEKNVVRSKVDLEAAYAFLAKYTKQHFEINFFLAGKGYSELNTDAFKSDEIQADPREYNQSVLDEYEVYSDFDPDNCINLLKPYDKEFMKKIENLGKTSIAHLNLLLVNFRKFAIYSLAA